ncbi:MAG: tetratricopeptide repeat protein [Flavobacteriales bacterium]|nr:tetratricopeptide repeat protein [Flavobacteriales bacterium]
MTDLVTQGNEHFKAGEYTLAIEAYEAVIAEDKESAELYYNLGNAYYKFKNVPAAILNYERAIKLDPSDEDLQFNLKLVNLKTVDKIEVIPTFFIGELGQELKDMFSLNTWGLIAIIALWISAALFFVFASSTANLVKRLLFFFALFLLAVSLSSLGLGYQKYKSAYKQVEAIVFAPSVIVKSAPDPNETDLFLLHEGTKVLVVETMAEWNKIRLADGSIGWIPVQAIEQI